MKAFVSALTLGLVLAFSAPAFASTAGAYVGDMIGGKPAPKPTKTVESKTTKHHDRKHAY
jgi:hypothetical protein